MSVIKGKDVSFQLVNVKKGSGAIIYIPEFHRDWFSYSKIVWGGGVYTSWKLNSVA
jgi:hypothetical protein